MSQELHDLVAPYALDALDEEERAAFERHLEECERCPAELTRLQGAAGALAYAVEGPELPAGLRERILEAARAENGARVIELPRRRWLLPVTASAAAMAAVVAIGVGTWATSLARDLDRERSAKDTYARAFALLGGRAEVKTLADAEGSLLVAADGRAALAVCGLETAAEDKTYEAWVVERGTPQPAGLFRGGSGCPPVLLDRKVSEGAVVAVTLEPKGGSRKPTGQILLRSEAV
jgi:anti-sigma factor RsiW